MCKKVVVSLVVLLMLAMLLVPGVRVSAEVDILQFQDDFSEGMSLWNGVSGSWLVDGGVLMNTTTGVSAIEMKGINSVWQEQTAEVRLQRVQDTGSGFIGIQTRYVSNASNLMLMVRSTGINYKIGSGGETVLYSYAFALGTDYDIKVSMSGSTATVYVKPASETDYITAGTISGVPVQSGKVRFNANGVKMKIDNVYVWNSQISDFMADGSMVSSINTGSSAALPLKNTTGKDVVWTSGDTSIATVDQNGVVTGVNRGLVTITAATVDNSDQAQFDIYIKDPVNTAGLLQFHDDFNNDMYMWSVAGGAWAAENARLVSKVTALSEVEIRGSDTTWRNQTVSLRFNMGQTTGSYIGIMLRYASSSDYTMLMVRGTGLNYMIAGGAETPIYSYSFTPGTDYDIQLIAIDDLVKVYVKTAIDANYTLAGAVANVPYRYGQLRLKTYNTTANFDDIKVWNNESTPFMLGKKITVLNAGSTETLALTNTTGKSVTWSSSNTAVATVDQTGKITAAGQGTMEITAATVDNSYQEKCFVIVNPLIDPVGTLQFQDDFSTGILMWNKISGSMTGANGRLYFNQLTSNVAEMAGTSTVWDNQTISLRFKRVEASAGDYLGVAIRYAGGTDNTLLLIRPTGINYKKGSSGETNLYSYTFSLNTDYDLKILAYGDAAKVYIKAVADADYTFAGAINGIFVSPGKIRLTAYNLKAEIDDVNVWNNNVLPFAITQKLSTVPIGTTKALSLTNTGSESVTWGSSNTAVATVDAAGIVTPVGKGLATITATGTEHSDQADIIVNKSVTSITLSKASVTLNVGDNTNLSAVVNPSDADNKLTTWTVSDPSVISLYGSASKARAIQAIGPGTATVTVTTLDNGYSATCQVTVNPAPAPVVGTARFSVAGQPAAIPANIFGVHYSPQSRLFKTTNYNPVTYKDLFSDIKAKNTRSTGEFYLYKDGTVINTSDPRYSEYYGTRTLAGVEAINPVPGYPFLYLPDVYNMPESLGVPHVLCVNVSSQPVQTILDEIQQIKTSLATKPIYIELGNELYASLFDHAFPRVDDYIAKCKQIYQGVKAIDPSIKVGIVICDKGLEEAVMADPANYESSDPDVDMAATQGGRVAIWNRTIAEDTSFYDAVIPHIYTGIPSLDGMTASSLMRYLYTANKSILEGYQVQSEEFKGKEIWVTEYGNLPMVVFGEADGSEKARLQFMKTPGLAVHYMERVMQMIQSGKITISDYHYLVDPQGFGIAQPTVSGDDSSLTMLPNYYVFKAIGDLLSTETHFYNMNLTQGNIQNEKLLFVGYDAYYKVQDVDAWGFGDVNGVKKIVFANRTSNPVNISVPGMLLKKSWAYGGSSPFPDFAANPAASWTDAPVTIPTPESAATTYDTTLQLSPFSMTIADVSGVAFDADAYSPGVNGTYATAVKYTDDTGVVSDVTASSTYSSADASVATVSTDGTVTGQGYGSTKISATYGSNISDANVNIGALSFQDAFSGGMTNWTPVMGTWAVNSESLDSTSFAASTIDYGGASVWNNQTVSVRVKRVAENTTNNFMGIAIRYVDDTNYTMVMIRPTQVNYKIGSGAETALGTYAFSPGAQYDIKIVAVGSSAKVYVKEASQTTFSLIGTIANASSGSGKVRLRTYNLKGSFDDVKVWDDLTGISLDSSTYDLDENTTHSTVVMANYSSGASSDVTSKATYTSSDTTVATVSTSGLVTGVQYGRATITSVYEGKVSSATVDVKPVFSKISIDNDNYYIDVEGTQAMKVSAQYTDRSKADVTNIATYSSSNTNVAAVSSTGVITGIAAGTAQITASYLGQTAVATVTVGKLLFQDAFSGGMTNWTPVMGTWAVNSESLNSTSFAASTIDYGSASAWNNQTVSVRVKRVAENTTNNFMGIAIRYVDDTNYTMVMIRPTQVNYKIGSGAETALGTYAFSLGAQYDIKIVAVGSSVKVYVKEASQTTFSLIGTIANASSGSGKVRLRTYNLEGSFDDIKVWSSITGLSTDSTLYSVNSGSIHSMAVIAYFDDGSTVDVTNMATYRSSDTTRAKVYPVYDINGVRIGTDVKGIEAGTAIITVSYQGREATVNVTVEKVARSLALDATSYSLAVGGTHNTAVTATLHDYSTGDVTASAAYSSSNPAAAEVSASGTVTAVGAGSAVITVTYQEKTAVVYVTVN